MDKYIDIFTPTDTISFRVMRDANGIHVQFPQHLCDLSVQSAIALARELSGAILSAVIEENAENGVL